jgi:hypothetical protein
MKNQQLKKCVEFSLNEIKKLTSKDFLEKELNEYLQEEIGNEDDFFKNNYIFVEDNVDSVKKAILDTIDENCILEDLIEAKKILNKIEKYCDNYYYTYIAIDKAQ